MSKRVNDDEEDDAVLKRIKEESLRHYKEVESRRINGEPCSSRDLARQDASLTRSNSPSIPIWYDGKEAEGFYLAAGSTYVYPTNYPVREYQQSIVKTAIFKNTLVSLPTGLGKTFIAAVVMYNYYRWYPNGKIVFMAPTRPLVAQQIKACYNIMGLPMDDSTEMTGNLNAQDRSTLWKEKRVFFLTPQVMVNDIKSKSCPAKLVKCLVIDEAHRAVKDYAYCHVVSSLDNEQATYRILALSATPGNDINGVVQIIQNLRITSLEFRGEDALDVIKYTHQKSVQSLVVNLSINIQRVKGDFLQVYEKYAKRLREYKAMNCNIATVSKFQILKASEKFRARPPQGLSPSLVGSIICDFSVCMSLSHALELLQIYGLRAFLSYLNDGGEKNKAAATRLKNDSDLNKMLERLQKVLCHKPGEEGYIWGHPKLYKLTSVLSEHFGKAKEEGESTKAIIFCQYRVVVNEVLEVLTNLNSDIKPVMFVGQSSSNSKDKGMTQAKQLEIMKNFQLGVYNCMIATCVAEEGLDIGEVDLIILMEAHKSPIRLVQRIGRTGRKRNGKCIVLVTEGREEYKFKEAMAARKSYVSNVLNAKSVREKLCAQCPSMFPPGIKPTRQLLHIEVIDLTSPEKLIVPKQADIRSHLVQEASPFITQTEFDVVKKELNKTILSFDKLPETKFLFHRINHEKMPIDELLDKDFNSFSNYNDWNLQLQETHKISHTKDSELMCGLLNRFYLFDVHFFSIKENGLKDPLKRKREVEILTDDDEDLLITKRGKRSKKDGNFGMDIRLCIAGKPTKGKLNQKLDSNEIIDVEEYEEINCNDDKLIDEIIQNLEKELQLKCPTINQSESCSPFDTKTISTIDSFNSPIKRKNMALFSLKNNFKKTESEIVDEIISGIEIIKLEKALNRNDIEQDIDPISLRYLEISHRESIESQKTVDNLVEVDELFNLDQQDGDGATQNAKNNLQDDIKKEGNQRLEEFENQKKQIKEFEDQNKESEFKEQMKPGCNTRSETPLPKQSDNYWESIPDELFDYKATLTPKNNKILISSTPKTMKSTLSKKSGKSVNFCDNIQSPIPKDTSDYEWNLDDLFEIDEAPNRKNKSNNQNISEMLGITEMVSLIEREKMANIKQNEKVNSQDESKNSEWDNLNNSGEMILTQNVRRVVEIESNNESSQSLEKNLLDEDDDLFTSLADIASSQNKNNCISNKNISNLNYSSDIFSSSIKKRCSHNNDQINVNKTQSVMQPDSAECKNFVEDFDDLFNDIKSVDVPAPKPPIESTETLEIQNSNNEITNVDDIIPHECSIKKIKHSEVNKLEVINIKNSEKNHYKNNKISIEQAKKMVIDSIVDLSCKIPNEAVEVTKLEVINLIDSEKTQNEIAKEDNITSQKCEHELDKSHSESTKVNFKRFTSNRDKKFHSQTPISTNNVTISSKVATISEKLSDENKELKINNNGTELSEFNEEWWFDFDFPNYSTKSVVGPPKKSEENTLICKKSIIKENDSNNKITMYYKVDKPNIWNKNVEKIQNNETNSENIRRDEALVLSDEEDSNENNPTNIKTFTTDGIQKELEISENMLSICQVQSLTSDNQIVKDKTESVNSYELSSFENFYNKMNEKIKIIEKNNQNEISSSSSSKNANYSSKLDDLDESIFRTEPSASRTTTKKVFDQKCNGMKDIKSKPLSVKVKSSCHRKKKRRRKKCEFIENEAEISEDNDTSTGDDNSSGLEELDQSFIDDQETSPDNIHAKYLQSVKSPIRGKFKIPNKINNDSEIYSQYECNDTDYINDSFCVETEDSSDENELSAIEIAERKIEENRRKQKQNAIKKRRRIKIISPDNSDYRITQITPVQHTKTIERTEKQSKKKLFVIPSDSDGSDNSPLLIKKRIKLNSIESPNNLLNLKSTFSKINSEEEDEDFLVAIKESQQSFQNSIKAKEIEDKELEEAIKLSKASLNNFNQPSTSKSRY